MLNKNIFTRITAIVVASFVHAIAINFFITPSGMVSSGFTGLSMLTINILQLVSINLPLSLFIVLYNLPVALLCLKSISKRFVMLSLIEIFLVSFLVGVLPVTVIFDDIILNSIFGGVLNGTAIVLALKANASTGGTDFIALYVSNKIQKSIFNEVLVFNIIIIVIFGIINGWYYAGYSIVFQFISTQTINHFYKRYERVTLQIVTAHYEDVIKAYTEKYRHGMSIIDVEGAYKHEKFKMLNTVISVYEQEEICSLIKSIDHRAIINVFKTTSFYGGFYIKPID